VLTSKVEIDPKQSSKQKGLPLPVLVVKPERELPGEMKSN